MKTQNFSKKLNPFNPFWDGTVEPLELEPLREPPWWSGTLVDAFENIDPPETSSDLPFLRLGYPVSGLQETSVFVNLTKEDLLSFPPPARIHIDKIRREKFNHTRPRPSQTLIDKSTIMSSDQRKRLLDAVALLVDQDLFGRCGMCVPTLTQIFTVTAALA